ncbi:hypothetical protein RF11_08429 [Thelohanellus kitauei]|uniref:Uncharacterized protein n=1 Tax=Thelohanellus kitauei TaxID=669202 RepID=A0A0C2MRQ7_THEKT|nr:hypothetical protein RF11_08429 [Thelohanellus kitauei]
MTFMPSTPDQFRQNWVPQDIRLLGLLVASSEADETLEGPSSHMVTLRASYSACLHRESELIESSETTQNYAAGIIPQMSKTPLWLRADRHTVLFNAFGLMQLSHSLISAGSCFISKT